MAESERPLIYSEWWVFIFLVALVVFPWPTAAGLIGDQSDRRTGWLIFLGAFALTLIAASLFSVSLHRKGLLFPRTKTQAETNRAKTLRWRSYWPIGLSLAVGIRFGPLWLQLVGLGLIGGGMVVFTVTTFMNAIRRPPT